MSWISGDSATAITDFTYTEDNKPASVSFVYPLAYSHNYKDVYSYNKNGNMISCTRTFNDMTKQEYTAKKITDNKYILYDQNQKEYLTVIFDNSGFIVSYRYASGYVTEYSFTYDENGKPVSFKHLDIRPSGSRQIIDYTIRFKDDNTFCMYNTEDTENTDEYYEVKYQKINVKG